MAAAKSKEEAEGEEIHSFEGTNAHCVLSNVLDRCSGASPERVPSILSPVLSSIMVCADGCTDQPHQVNGGMDVVLSPCEDDSIHHISRTQFLKFVQKMMERHRKSDVAMTMLGVRCMDDEEHDTAEKCFRAALGANPDNLMAAENLRILQEKMVHRWHFHMLNDIQRNSAYSKAIGKVIETLQESSAVIDIGCGTGLLSMLCVQAGAGRVYGVEVNDRMVGVCAEVLRSNGMEKKVQLLHSLSTRLSVPAHIPTRAELVVTEIVDAGLLGEHIIPTLRHAWRELLLPPPTSANCHAPSGHVIPSGATVYAVAIECAEIRKKSQLLATRVMGVSFEGVTLEGSCKAREEPLSGGRGQGHMTEWLEREIYTCERMSQIRGGSVSLTAALPVLQFDFSNPDIPLPESHVSFAVTRSGRLDAIAVWFDLHLHDDVFFSTSPSWDLSWEQAVFPQSPPQTHPHQQDYQLEEGDTILLHASCSELSLYMHAELAERAKATGGDGCDAGGLGESGGGNSGRGYGQYSDGNQHSDDGEGGDRHGDGYVSPRLFHVERADLLRLNDTVYTNKLEAALRDVVKIIKEGEEESSDEMECTVLCLHQGLSVCGITAARLGADYVLVALSSPAYFSLLSTLVEQNGIKDHVSVQLQGAGRWCHTHLMWDVLVCDVVTPQGTLSQGILEKIVHVRETQFHASSIVIPSKLVVMAMLVSSPSMRAHCSVLGTVPTLGLEVAPVINTYQISHFVDIDVAQHPMQLLSEPFQVMHINLNALRKKDLQNLHACVHVPVISSGCVTGVVYWFQINLHGNIHVSTSPRQYSQSHWHQSVFMLPQDMEVTAGTTITVTGLIRDSYLQLCCLRNQDWQTEGEVKIEK